MTYLSATQVTGHELRLARTDPRHLAGRLDPPMQRPSDGTFGSLLLDSLKTVGAHQQTAEALAVRAVVDPESVDAHDVAIAAARASLSLSLAKAVVDRVVAAYREIQNVR